MGISSDIAGVLSLIQQQQAIEERKAERDQDLALKLMQIDKMDREYEDSLVATYGPENLIEDVETGRTRVKKLDEGFDMEFSPDFKMKKLLSDLDEEKYLKGVRLSKSIELFDSKVMEREKVASRIRSDYSGLDEKFISGNFATVANTFNNIETGETGAIKSSIEELNKDIAGLNELSSLLAEQELYYKAQESEYAGKTGFVDPGEFYGPDGMLTEYQELYPDRPIAGLEKAYLTGLVQPRIREKAMEEQQDRARAITQQSYQDLKGLLSSEEFDISNYTDDERLQKEFGEVIQHGMAESFLTDINLEPTGRLKELFYSINDNIMSAMESNYQDVGLLRAEYEGTDIEDYSSKLEQDFSESLLNLKSKKEAFILYDSYLDKIPSDNEKKMFFNKIEEHFGGADLYKEYTSHLNPNTVKGKAPSVTLREGVLDDYRMSGTEEIDVEAIYSALDEVDISGIEDIDEATWALSDPYTITAGTPPGLGGFGDFTVQRPDYSAGKAFFGGTLGGLVDTDSPYYDTYYNEMQKILKTLVQEKDPLGPDWYFYGFPEESHSGTVIRENFGEAMYQKAHEAADKLAKESQINKIKNVLNKGSGEDYNDLLRALEMIRR